MSFSSVIKAELCRVESRKICCAHAEIAAAFAINRAAGVPPDCLVTENAAFARRVYSLFRFLRLKPPEIGIDKNKKLYKSVTYVVRLNTPEDSSAVINGGKEAGGADIGGLRSLIKKKCCKKAALRGAFLAAGSISDPDKLYHLEIYSKNKDLTRYFAGLIVDFNLNPKITERSEYYVAYIKDSSQIVDFLNLTGAHQALLALENTRILKDMRNNVNRAVNCETANLEKTVNASLRQNANIAYIKETIGFEALPAILRDIATIRENNKEISLKELGQLLDPPLGKSGVNHRLRRLDMLAGELRLKNNSL